MPSYFSSYTKTIALLAALSCSPLAAQNTAAVVPAESSEHLVLHGAANETIVKSEFGKLVSILLAQSLASNEDFQEIEKEKKIKHKVRKSFSRVAGVLGEVVSINATASSKEGAQIILDETDDWDERDALIYQEQKIIDDLHPRIAAAVLQAVMGRGQQTNSNATDLTERAMKELEKLCGATARKLVEEKIVRWQTESNETIPMSRFPKDLISRQQDLNLLTEAAVQDDPALSEMRHELEKVARPNIIKDRLNSTLQTMLDTTAYMMPTAGIAAGVEAIKGVLVVSTGGCEEDKLQHLMFLLKRLASRRSALGEEIRLAAYARDMGLQTNNHLLVECAEAATNNLVSPQAIKIVLANRKMQAEKDSEE